MLPLPDAPWLPALPPLDEPLLPPVPAVGRLTSCPLRRPARRRPDSNSGCRREDDVAVGVDLRWRATVQAPRDSRRPARDQNQTGRSASASLEMNFMVCGGAERGARPDGEDNGRGESREALPRWASMTRESSTRSGSPNGTGWQHLCRTAQCRAEVLIVSNKPLHLQGLTTSPGGFDARPATALHRADRWPASGTVCAHRAQARLRRADGMRTVSMG